MLTNKKIQDKIWWLVLFDVTLQLKYKNGNEESV
jgi:hypothetical protein